MQPSRGRWFALLLAAFFALASLACFAYPLYVIRPFRYQGATELRIALFVLHIAPWVSILCALACLALIVLSWNRTHGWLLRTAAVMCVLIATAGAVLARVNLYEKMFHPIAAPAFEAANQAHIDAADFVLAVRVNGASRAYPIRQIAYHHIVNDTVGGVPLVATY
jgi:glucan phosphoethanolaminetransferase (alkaline phosphatase superfamily)